MVWTAEECHCHCKEEKKNAILTIVKVGMVFVSIDRKEHLLAKQKSILDHWPSDHHIDEECW